MKVDGKALAKEHASRKKENKSLTDEGKIVEKEVLDKGNHISSMMSLIESIHNKDSEQAHHHMIQYLSHVPASTQSQEQPK